MSTKATMVQTFPSVHIPSESGGLPVEVSLIAQLGHGAGDRLCASASARQRAHADFIDALNEPSARLGAMDLSKDDPTSLYSFSVGADGHPFHRHEGHRVFTAISGSGGTQLRFSTVTPAQIDADPQSFIRALRYINIPPDSIFTVRFGGNIWHQFAPLRRHSLHPAFFALSCHTNELGGNLSDALREQVLANETSIPALTMLLPQCVIDLLQNTPPSRLHVPTSHLSLDAPPGSLHNLLCRSVRCVAGLAGGIWAAWRSSTGFMFESGGRHSVVELGAIHADSLLAQQLNDAPCDHEDVFCLTLNAREVAGMAAPAVLSRVLEGFLRNPPAAVSRMMTLRNLLVKPIGLRTSPLGCPVSSLLSPVRSNLFDERYPVIDQAIANDGTRAEVILGANDKHLIFRSCVGVRFIASHQVEVTLGSRVQCKNRFGRLYMAAIDHMHRSYVTPTMLRMAVEHAFPSNAQINEPRSRQIAARQHLA